MISIPKHRIEIFSCDILNSRMTSKETFAGRVAYALAVVSGDFRQRAISLQWKEVLEKSPDVAFPAMHMRLLCSSGTYVRSIAHDLGRKIGSSALALRIVRTKVGDMRIEDALR